MGLDIESAHRSEVVPNNQRMPFKNRFFDAVVSGRPYIPWAGETAIDACHLPAYLRSAVRLDQAPARTRWNSTGAASWKCSTRSSSKSCWVVGRGLVLKNLPISS